MCKFGTMKNFLLRGGFGPLKACRAAARDGRSWSLKRAFDTYVAFGRSVVKSLFEERLLKQKPINLSRKVDGTPVSGLRCSGKPSKWSTHVGRIVSKWSSESWAAELRRNAAKKIMFFQGGATLPLFTLVGFTLAKEPSLITEHDRLQVACQEIRDAFRDGRRKNNENKYDVCLPKKMTLSDLELGEILAKGCNAVVYSATWKKNPVTSSARGKFLWEKGGFGTLAVKVMFNYDADSDASSIWRAMHRESVPARFKYLPSVRPYTTGFGEFRLPPHPNIVEMHCAFADQFPNLPGGIDLYPDALPTRLNSRGFGRNMTLLLVMKRYDCSLKEYLRRRVPSARTSLELFAQLLEGILHLFRHGVSHRDLKADNILLDLTSRGESRPLLAITDFGCCLADERLGLKLPLCSEDVFRGGNVALMPPEVSKAVPGRFCSIDYSASDLWVAGALAYEIFGGKNPFYPSSGNPFRLDSASYDDRLDLPPFPPGAHPTVQRIVRNVLSRNPKKRPRVETVATSVQLLLHAPPEWIGAGPDESEIFCWLAATALSCLGNEKRSDVLLETFLSRARLDEVTSALDYLRSLSDDFTF